MTIEEQFHFAMIEIYERVKTELYYIDFHLIQTINELGGLQAAKRILKDNFSEGFETLSDRRRLDVSVEALILNIKWSGLFTIEEKIIAKERLSNHKFDVSQLLGTDN